MRLVSIGNTKPGHPVAKTIYDSFGRVLLIKGTPLTQDYINRLKKLKFRSLYIGDEHSELIEVDNIVCEETRNEVDPDIVPEFVSVIAPYPVGSVVLLNSGLIGKVVEIKKINPTKPIVKLLCDVQGQAISEVRFIDLTIHSSDFILDVIGK